MIEYDDFEVNSILEQTYQNSSRDPEVKKSASEPRLNQSGAMRLQISTKPSRGSDMSDISEASLLDKDELNLDDNGLPLAQLLLQAGAAVRLFGEFSLQLLYRCSVKV